ncbi:MAG: hypothetical protein OMM_05760 [Candidatus Magnetoglobus multicellularis str. Araruama]|uniref:DUF4116 domain-containing protein n=1 Tax=Candidatus Magnetoglobus multicellularis str. Araruama TaxID=890399 RepID=A0A1V1NUD8_9BACT|nr:MAG: hypothetical protein OMM_05760 [Candidatus Magnetoglobus multicellularis str. Araruama]
MLSAPRQADITAFLEGLSEAEQEKIQEKCHELLTSEETREAFENNKAVVTQAVMYNQQSYQFASYDLRQDLDIILQGVGRNHGILKYCTNGGTVNDSILNDKDSMLKIIERAYGTFKFASKNLMQDPDFVRKVLDRADFGEFSFVLNAAPNPEKKY